MARPNNVNVGHLKTRATEPAGADPQALGTKDRILAVATQQFAHRGFEGVVIRDIAKAAEVTLPSVYHFFSNKRELYEYACVIIFEKQNASLTKALLSSDDPLVRLKAFTTKLMAIFIEDSNFARLLQRELVEADYLLIDSTTRKALQPHFEMLVKAVANLTPKKNVYSRSIAIYSLAFGLAILRPVWSQLNSKNVGQFKTANEASRLILDLIFPEVDWIAMSTR